MLELAPPPPPLIEYLDLTLKIPFVLFQVYTDGVVAISPNLPEQVFPFTPVPFPFDNNYDSVLISPYWADVSTYEDFANVSSLSVPNFGLVKACYSSVPKSLIV